MYNNEKNNDENFWISYADLMAGLLFVFILVIGAIVTKYLYSQNDLKVIKTDLKKEQLALNLSEEELESKRKKILLINDKLNKTKEEKVHLAFQLAKSQNSFNETKDELEKTKKESELLNKNLNIQDDQLKLSLSKIEKITSILEDKDDDLRLLNTKYSNQESLLNQQTAAIKLNDEEIEKFKALLFSYSLKEKEQKELNEKLESQIDENKTSFKLKDEELALLEKQFLMQTNLHQKLVEEFDITKSKIKNLTGIKIQVISKLRDKLGKSINIDERSGAIQFSSNILFDQGEFELKEKSKQKLSGILKKYLQTLLKDDSIKQHIHSITIEGHTNSDGSYLNNLKLSQKRALEVMQFLYTSNIIDKKLLRQYVNSSGKSYSDIIYKDGVEDKDNSRRIEIKFRIKNESSIKELQKFLGDK